MRQSEPKNRPRRPYSEYHRRHTVDLRFYDRQGEVHLTITGRGSQFYRYAGSWTYQELQSIQTALIQKLEAYQAHPDPTLLRNLAKAGWEQYQRFLLGLKPNARKWWEDVVKLRKEASAPILRVTVPKMIAIPIQLFYVRDYAKIKTREDYQSIIQHFLGIDCQLTYKCDRDEGLANPMLSLCSKIEDPTIIHVADLSLDHVGQEVLDVKAFSKNVIAPTTIGDLIKIWQGKTRIHIVHWSAHLKEDSSKRRYLTFDKNNGVKVEDLVTLTNPLPFPPLLFLNTCDSGSISITDSDNFVFRWYPQYASGAIATFSRVGDKLATEVSKNFYANFKFDSSILESLHHATTGLAKTQQHLAAIAYSVWEVDPFLTLHPQPSC